MQQCEGHRVGDQLRSMGKEARNRHYLTLFTTTTTYYPYKMVTAATADRITSLSPTQVYRPVHTRLWCWSSLPEILWTTAQDTETGSTWSALQILASAHRCLRTTYS